MALRPFFLLLSIFWVLLGSLPLMGEVVAEDTATCGQLTSLPKRTADELWHGSLTIQKNWPVFHPVMNLLGKGTFRRPMPCLFSDLSAPEDSLGLPHDLTLQATMPGAGLMQAPVPLCTDPSPLPGGGSPILDSLHQTPCLPSLGCSDQFDAATLPREATSTSFSIDGK